MEKSNNKTKLPTYMVADFESILVPVDEDEANESKTKITARHLPCSFGIKIVSEYPELEDFFVYTGRTPEDTMKKFCKYIIAAS